VNAQRIMEHRNEVHRLLVKRDKLREELAKHPSRTALLELMRELNRCLRLRYEAFQMWDMRGKVIDDMMDTLRKHGHLQGYSQRAPMARTRLTSQREPSFEDVPIVACSATRADAMGDSSADADLRDILKYAHKHCASVATNILGEADRAALSTATREVRYTCQGSHLHTCMSALVDPWLTSTYMQIICVWVESEVSQESLDALTWEPRMLGSSPQPQPRTRSALSFRPSSGRRKRNRTSTLRRVRTLSSSSSAYKIPSASEQSEGSLDHVLRASGVQPRVVLSPLCRALNGEHPAILASKSVSAIHSPSASQANTTGPRR
jgi:hypothetical protein